MTVKSPLTTAWDRVREQLRSTAETHRANGTSAVEAVADHGTIRAPSSGPVELVFTVPGDTIDSLHDRINESSVTNTDVQYADAAGHRLYLLTIRTSDGPNVLVAGGVRHNFLRDNTGSSGRLRTCLRGVDNRIGLQVEHDNLDPFVEGIQ